MWQTIRCTWTYRLLDGRGRAGIRPAGPSRRGRDAHARQYRSGGYQRRPLLLYAALVLEYIPRIGKPRLVRSRPRRPRRPALPRLLKRKEQEKAIALIEAARSLNPLRLRLPRHGEEPDRLDRLRFMATSVSTTGEERRLRRHAARLLGDTGWRAHPDYRGEQSLNIVAHGGLSGIDHPGRAYLALAPAVGLVMDDELSAAAARTGCRRMFDRARVLGAAMRLAYVVSAAMPVLVKTSLAVERHLAGAAPAELIRRLGRRAGAQPLAARWRGYLAVNR